MKKKYSVCLKVMGLGLGALLVLLFHASDLWACSVGDRAQVKWKGRWYPATVIAVNQGSLQPCRIHYDTDDSSWDEWVGPSRIRIIGSRGSISPSSGSYYNVGESVHVLWNRKWWPAQVRQVGNNRWYIHYNGYANSWDEWVDAGRIRR